MFAEIDFSAFPPEREESLKGIYRYSMFDVMFYRSNLWMHAQRMLWVIEAIAPIVKQRTTVDVEKARVLALVHDDAEMITGDIQAGVKAHMSEAEMDCLEKNEEAAIEQLTARYPKEVHGYDYREMLRSMLHKDTLESQFVSYIDKFDAYNESLLEVLAGNISLLRSMMFYVKTIAEFPFKYPDLAPLLRDKTSSITDVDHRNYIGEGSFERYAHLAPHTIDSIRQKTEFPFHDEWRRIVLENGGEEGLRWLTEQKESVQ